MHSFNNSVFFKPPAVDLTMVDERARLHALHELDLLDTEPEEEFDELALLASEICDTPISLVSLVDSERQWFKAAAGLDEKETHRDYSFCARAIKQSDIFVVEDASCDPRFVENPLVTGDPNIRFYAGVPLMSAGHAIGTLCVIDTQPRELTDGQKRALLILARQVQGRIELRAQRKALVRSNAELERLATIDALTGLHNRRVLDERLAIQYAVAERSGRPMSLILMDIDDFKARNDRFGHESGDEALRILGRILRDEVRLGDTAARFGGEEFVLLLPETSGAQARVVGERIQAALAQVTLESGAITVSMGISVKDETTQFAGEMLRRADDAMYEAKRAGKNRIVLHQEYILKLLQQSLTGELHIS